MEQTFNNAAPAATGSLEQIQAQDQQRQQANQQGQQNESGAASRAQAASLDPKEHDPKSGVKPSQDPNI